MAESVKKPPKICAVCGCVLDMYLGGYVHSAEVFGNADHVAVPVDYDERLLVTNCDFCRNTVPLEDRWVVPTSDFQTPMGSMSYGGWAACPSCAKLVTEGKWTVLIDQFMEGAPADTHEDMKALLRSFLEEMYAQVRANQTGAPRHFQPGDEAVVHQEA